MGLKAKIQGAGGYLFRGRHTLTRKIAVGILPVVVAVTIVIGVFGYLGVRREILGNAQQEMNSLAQNTALGLQAFFQQRRNDLESLSETPLIADYHKNSEFGLLQESNTYRRELGLYFRNFANRSKVYDDISYVKADGRYVCSLRAPGFQTLLPRSVSIDFLNDLRRTEVFEGSLERLVDGGPILKRYAKSVFSSGGIFLGAVILDCDMTFVEETLRKLRVGKLGGTFLQDSRGEVVLGSKPSFQWPLVGLFPVTGTPWHVGIVAPSADFLKSLKRVQVSTVAFGLVAGVLVLLLILRQVSTSLNPIQRLAQGTQRFASGDLSYRFEEPETDELKILASSFNHMAESLEERNRELEQRLRQITALRDMEETVIQRLDEDTILRNCLESVARGFSFDRTSLYWVDYGKKEIVGRRFFGSEDMRFTEAAFRRRRIPLGGADILNEVIRTRAPVLVKNPMADSRLDPSFLAETKTREFILAPILSKARVLGILTADNYYLRRPLVDADKDGLMLFADAVGLALENTTLFTNLTELEARYRSVLDNSPEAVIGLSREHWITTWNRGAEAMFGYAAPEIIGKPVTALFSSGSGVEFKKLLSSVVEKGSVRDHSMPGITRGGLPFFLSVSWGGAYPDFWMNKEWSLVIRDVTEARKMQQQLIRSEKLSAIGQLISGIAHELNNPLQAVVGYAELLSDELTVPSQGDGKRNFVDPKSAPAFLDDLRIITDNAMRCQKIIENLLLFVRQGEIEKKPLDLWRVVQASLELLHYKLKKVVTIEVEVQIPPSFPQILGNFQQIQQVVVNLISNACDAMGSWEGPKRLEVTASFHGKRVKVNVSDSGPGIPENIQDHLFEPFFTTKPEGRGTGLGLAVCRQIIEDQGGTIGFRSEKGQGTTFWFDVPLAESSDIPLSGRPLVPAIRDKSILVVDDEPDVLSFLLKVLEAEGDQVEKASSLREASLKSSQRPYDLVVTDVHLGEGTGIHLYENWALVSAFPRPAFLFITGDVINQSLAQEIEKKGLLLIHKPIDLNSFQQTFRTLLAKA
jgi:two-component system NtrC family sensor kinase